MNSTDFEKYNKLKIEDVSSISPNDLPQEFSYESFKTIDEFIKKTKNLDYECALYFDYISGEILKCAIGDDEEVSLVFEEGEFDNNHVASVHNHPKTVYSPPSGKNFGILMRDFEQYELISGLNELWIFKAQCVNEHLMIEFNVASIELFKSARHQASLMCSEEYLIDELCDLLYGDFLLKYINDKNIRYIQLTKKVYRNGS